MNWNEKTRVIDNTTVPVGGKIKISDSFSGSYFDEGDEPTVVGFGVSSEDRLRDEPFMVGDKVYGAGYYHVVEYLVQIYDATTGKPIRTYPISSFETHNYLKEKTCDAFVLMKPAIAALRAAGLEHQAVILEAQRFTRLNKRLEDRREQLADRALRDKQIAFRTLARMSIGHEVTFRHDKLGRHTGTLNAGTIENDTIMIWIKGKGNLKLEWDLMTEFTVNKQLTNDIGA